MAALDRDDSSASATAPAVSLRYFDELYREGDDPWGFRTRWYELRKRTLLLACLTQQRYRRAYEPACANGELAAALAPRCESLLASDYHPQAVASARQRLAGLAHVQVEQRSMPQQWPDGSFDLIVIGELGYYLGEPALRQLAERIRASLSAGGTLLACHWRHAIEGCPLRGDEVHAVLRQQLQWQRLVLHTEADFLLELWTAEPARPDPEETSA